jgi:hypothetical protein
MGKVPGPEIRKEWMQIAPPFLGFQFLNLSLGLEAPESVSHPKKFGSRQIGSFFLKTGNVCCHDGRAVGSTLHVTGESKIFG